MAGLNGEVSWSVAGTRGVSMLQVGKHVQVIGAWRPDTDDIDIATVYAAA
jgi:hypothetical protein